MRLNILFRHFISYAIIIVFLTTIITIIVSREFKRSNINNLTTSLEKQADIISAEIADLLSEKKYSEIDSLVGLIARQIETRITIIRVDGKVIAESDYREDKMEDHSSRPEFIQAIQSGKGKIIRFSKTVNQNMLYVAVPIRNADNRLVAVVRTSAYLAQIEQSIKQINRKIIGSAIILTILALLLSIITSRNLTKPIRVISKVAEQIKSGQFNARLVLNRKDEIGRLAGSINEMAESLGTMFDSLNEEQGKIKTILSSMTEGLIVLDEKNRIALVNDSFKNISGYPDEIQGKYYWEVIQNTALENLIRQVNITNALQNQEIEFKDKFFWASAIVISRPHYKRIVILLHDVTEYKNLEKIKSEFVANVSHELKTPLTSIKGFAETLEDEASPKYKKFAETIRRNADRLINIVSDLLTISELERNELAINLEPIDLSLMLNNIKKIFAGKIKAKKISVKIELGEDAKEFKGDAFLIEQMFVNLIDNAVKYNKEKGKILVRSFKFDNQIKIEVEDTGIGIGEEHCPRIFERFYVVDKSRSRKMGGTGLGLAIVKHIVLSHNGKIDVESELGKGTKFVITLPIA